MEKRKLYFLWKVVSLSSLLLFIPSTFIEWKPQPVTVCLCTCACVCTLVCARKVNRCACMPCVEQYSSRQQEYKDL